MPRRATWSEAAAVVATLAVSTAVCEWNMLRDGLPVSLDSGAQYWPWYTFLGQSLRGGRNPVWNPSMFGGAPFAARAPWRSERSKAGPYGR
jgi:hypothetical protein